MKPIKPQPMSVAQRAAFEWLAALPNARTVHVNREEIYRTNGSISVSLQIRGGADDLPVRKCEHCNRPHRNEVDYAYISFNWYRNEFQYATYNQKRLNSMRALMLFHEQRLAEAD